MAWPIPICRCSSAGDFADEIAHYVNEVKKLADDKREKPRKQAELLRDNVFALDRRSHEVRAAIPTALKPVPQFDFAPLDAAVARLTEKRQSL